MSDKKPKPRGKPSQLPSIPLFAAEVIVGRTYLCLTCKTCGQWIALWEAIPNMPMRVMDDSFWFRDLPCPKCQARHDYPASSMQLQEAQPAGPVQ